jgi:hypothetical protein
MTSSGHSEQDCPSCGGPLSARQARPYPVLIQLLFAASFVAFLLCFEKLRASGNRAGIWAWSAVQAALGAALIRGRLLARKRVLRCIRCMGDVP